MLKKKNQRWDDIKTTTGKNWLRAYQNKIKKWKILGENLI